MLISQHGTNILYHSIIHDIAAKHKRKLSSVKKLVDPLSNGDTVLAKINSGLNGESECLKSYLEVVKENFNAIEKFTKNLILMPEHPASSREFKK